MGEIRPYTNVIPKIISSCERRITTIKSMREMFTGFCGSLSEVSFKLSALVLHAHEKQEIEKTSKFGKACTDWIGSFVANNDGIKTFAQRINEDIVKPIDLFLEEYTKSSDNIKKIMTSATTNLDEVEIEYKKLYDTYIEHCKSMEAEKDIAKVELMKKDCSKLEYDCIQFCSKLGIKRKEYCRDIETGLVNFEMSEKGYHKLIQNIVNAFSNLSRKLSDHYVKLSKDAANELPTIAEAEDLNQSENFFSRHQSLAGEVSIFEPQISFNIFDYISYKDVFEEQLKVKCACAIEDRPATIDFGPIVKGDLFEIIQKNRNTYKIESLQNGLQCEVPKSILSEKVDFKRYVATAKGQFPIRPGSSINVRTGEYVIVIEELKDQLRFKTATGCIGVASFDQLQPVK